MGNGPHHARNILSVCFAKDCGQSVSYSHRSSESPRGVGTVELLGSWDNFSKPYVMSRDSRRGTRVWSGCYTFENIICDGDLQVVGEKRSGGLKMGGTYWYYVRFH